jgi:glycerophosphoryl diester phosphodiesterase family protein
MTDSPGWASPGSSPSDRQPGDGEPDRGPASGGQPATPPPADGTGAGEGAEPPRNWSTQQPPPAPGGGWGAPPPPQRPAGWGGAGAYGPPGWNQPPQAAKPGVIPLRPLGVGEILDGAVSTTRAHWRTVLGLTLGVAVVMTLLSTLASGLLLSGNGSLQAIENNPAPRMDDLVNALTSVLSALGLIGIVTLVGTVIATAMLTVVVSRAVLGRPVTLGASWREAAPHLARMLGLTVLVALIVVGAFVVGVLPGVLVGAAGLPGAGAALGVLGGIAGLAAGVWLWVRFCLAAPALVLERQKVTGALRRSVKLVRGNWWRIFGVQLLALILVRVIAFVVGTPFELVAMFSSGQSLLDTSGAASTVSWSYLLIVAVGDVIALTLTLPLSAGITALLYMDQRIRREALDVELARAAGTCDPAAPGAAHQAPGN